MNWDLILLFLFAILLGILILLNKKKINVEKIAFPLIYILMYRTKLGLKQMDKLAKKFPKTISVLAYFGIIAGYASMILIFALLTLKVFEFLFAGSPSPIAPLLPGIKTVPGVPVLGFWHWIISIFILAAVHEFSHGLVARLHDVKLKSSGFGFFAIFLPTSLLAYLTSMVYNTNGPGCPRSAKGLRKKAFCFLSEYFESKTFNSSWSFSYFWQNYIKWRIWLIWIKYMPCNWICTQIGDL